MKAERRQESLEGLQNIVLKLDPVLNPYGFVFELESNGFSSLGFFASGYYKRLPIQIGLIYRHCLGSVNYEWDEFNMSHTDYMEYLGHAHDCKLIYNEGGFESVARDGGSPTIALIYDLEHFAKAMLEGDVDGFAHIVKTAYETRLKELYGEQYDAFMEFFRNVQTQKSG
jgi:hypothetical protein